MHYELYGSHFLCVITYLKDILYGGFNEIYTISGGKTETNFRNHWYKISYFSTYKLMFKTFKS